MPKLKGKALKWLKLVHLAAACCWIGAGIGLALLNIYNDQAVSDGMLHGINAAAHKLDIWVVVIFGVLGCLLTGLIYGLFTDWGFFRQRWLALKWLILLVAVTSGTFFLGEWEKAMLALSEEYGLAALRRADFTAIRSRHLWGTMLQLSMLFFVLFLSVFKPWRKKDGQGR